LGDGEYEEELKERKKNGEDIDIDKLLDDRIDEEFTKLNVKNDDIKNKDKRTPEEKKRDEKIATLTPTADKMERDYLAAYTEKDNPELYALKKSQAAALKEIMLNPDLSDEQRNKLISDKKQDDARAEVKEKQRLQELDDAIAGIKKIDPNDAIEKQRADAENNQKLERVKQRLKEDDDYNKALSASRKTEASLYKNSPAKTLKFSENNAKFDAKLDELREKEKNGEITREEMNSQLGDYQKELNAELEKVDAKDEFADALAGADKAIYDKKQNEYLNKYDSVENPELRKLKLNQFQELQAVYADKDLSSEERDKKIKELEFKHDAEEGAAIKTDLEHKTELANKRAALSKDISNLSDAEFNAYKAETDAKAETDKKKSDYEGKLKAEKTNRDNYIKSLSPDLQAKFYKAEEEISDKKKKLKEKVDAGEMSQEDMDTEIKAAEDKRDQDLQEEAEKAQKAKTDAQKSKEVTDEVKKLTSAESAYFKSLSPGQQIVRTRQLEAIAAINTDSSIPPEEKAQKLKDLETSQKQALEDVRFEEAKKLARQKDFEKKFKNGDLTQAQLNRLQEQNKELNTALSDIDKRTDLSDEEKDKLKIKTQEELEDKHLKEIEALDPSNKIAAAANEAQQEVNKINSRIDELKGKENLTDEEQAELDKLNDDKAEAEAKVKEAEQKKEQIEKLTKEIDALQKKYDANKTNLETQIKNQKMLTDALSNTNFKDEKPNNPFIDKFIIKLRNKNQVDFLSKLSSVVLHSSILDDKISKAQDALKSSTEALKLAEKDAKNQTSAADQEKVEIAANKEEKRVNDALKKQKEDNAKASLEAGGDTPEEAQAKIDAAKKLKEKDILDYKIQTLEKKLDGAKKAFDKMYSEDPSNTASSSIATNIDKIEKSIKELKQQKSSLGESFTNIDSYILAIDFLIDNVIADIEMYS
jgi:hypothetical protein